MYVIASAYELNGSSIIESARNSMPETHLHGAKQCPSLLCESLRGRQGLPCPIDEDGAAIHLLTQGKTDSFVGARDRQVTRSYCSYCGCWTRETEGRNYLRGFPEGETR